MGSLRTVPIIALAFGSLVGFGGCGTAPSSALPAAPMLWNDDDADLTVHVCPTQGPHQGQLIDVGHGAYHAELVQDEEHHRVGIYLLDTRAADSVPVTDLHLTMNVLVGGRPTQFRLVAVPLDGESPAMCSHFERDDRLLYDALNQPESSPRFNVTVHGKHFVVKIERHQHEHERFAQRD